MRDNAYEVALGLPYRPVDPAEFRPRIGLIGCGGITHHHLRAYRGAGYEVVALCDVQRRRAELRQREFYPLAAVYDDYRQMLARESLDVIDVATHPGEREEIIKAALQARKHVLSQKPFVLDLDAGERLCDLADQVDRKLVVNQNARWAPHFSWSRLAVEAGLIGELCGAHLSVHWDHSWVKGTPFEKVNHLILYDYAIHWFDMLTCLVREPAQRVYASTARSKSQMVSPPLLGQAIIEYSHAQASLAFDAHCPNGSQERTFLAGDRGSISSIGAGNLEQTLTLARDGWTFSPKLEGCWFPDGFHGTMGELLCSIESNRRSSIDARENLHSLALCFAAVASGQRGAPVTPGEVRTLPD